MDDEINKKHSESSKKIPVECPHCGKRLSPWQQVLLSVDRILTCKNCWYRIILEAPPTDEISENEEER